MSRDEYAAYLLDCCDRLIKRTTLTMTQNELERWHGERIIDILLDVRSVAAELCESAGKTPA